MIALHAAPFDESPRSILSASPPGSTTTASAASGAARVVLIVLDPGQSLGEHQVKEHAYVLILDGRARVEAGGETVEARAGTLCMFEPDERRSVSTPDGARILLLLAPWPGAGHYRGDAA